ncbi:MAG: hypothetical protein IKM02_02160 [Clostridia bacterium]|nr:hypothetical protein [Clostridia bacterium]
MLFSTTGQIYVFLWMMASGVLIAAWYACLSALRRLLEAGFWLSLVADAAFGAGAAIIFLAFLVTANYGRMRIYVLLAALLGSLLFAFGLCPILKAIGSALNRGLCRACCGLKQNRFINIIFR